MTWLRRDFVVLIARAMFCYVLGGTMRWPALLLFAFATGLQVAAAQPSEKKLITVAHAGPISPSVSLPLAIAQDHGIFAKHGLEVRLIGAFPGAARLIGKEAE